MAKATLSDAAQAAKYRAEDDARTLAGAAEITKDKSRTNKALAAAERQAKEAKQTAVAVKKVAKAKPKPPPRGGRKGGKKR